MEEKTKPSLTRAQKTEETKKIVRELLKQGVSKNALLIDEGAKVYAKRFDEEENPNDVRGRIGSVLNVMKERGEVAFVGGRVALTEEKLQELVQKSTPKPKSETKQEEKKTEEKPKAKAKAKTATATATKTKTDTTTKTKTTKPPVKKKVETKKEENTATDEELKEAFIKKAFALPSDLFERYVVYLLLRHARASGKRLESVKISGGNQDGGIDGDMTLTDKNGEVQTLYIQAKKWRSGMGLLKSWVIGETHLQQFLGACICRQRVDKAQNCLGIFVTTSNFTHEAAAFLQTMQDKIVGVDGTKLYQMAKEYQFGMTKEKNVWKVDTKLLQKKNAFFGAF